MTWGRLSTLPPVSAHTHLSTELKLDPERLHRVRKGLEYALETSATDPGSRELSPDSEGRKLGSWRGWTRGTGCCAVCFFITSVGLPPADQYPSGSGGAAVRWLLQAVRDGSSEEVALKLEPE